MSSAAPTQPPPASAPPAEDSGVQKRRLTVGEHYRMADAGIFEGERVELIDGELYKTISPQRAPHASLVTRLARVLERSYAPEAHTVRVQLPLSVSEDTEPEPDLLVARGDLDAFDERHPWPADAVLIVEIADSTLRQDTTRKAALYARCGVPEYWVVNVLKTEMESYGALTTSLAGERVYAERATLRPGDSVALPAGASVREWAVATLFPPRKG